MAARNLSSQISVNLEWSKGKRVAAAESGDCKAFGVLGFLFVHGGKKRKESLIVSAFFRNIKI